MSTPQNLHEKLTQTRDYITVLEDAILHICEGANLDAAALVEDLQTPARAQEMRKKIAALRKQNAAERKDRKTVYGKGGKVVREAAVDEGLINNIGKTIDTIHRVKRRIDQVRDVAREVKAGYDRMRGGSAKPKPASTRTRGGVARRIGSTVARAMDAARAARDSWARSATRTA